MNQFMANNTGKVVLVHKAGFVKRDVTSKRLNHSFDINVITKGPDAAVYLPVIQCTARDTREPRILSIRQRQLLFPSNDN